jgi:phosphomannomutase
VSPELDRIFKAYDVRGVVPDELDVDTARRIGGAFASWTGAPRILIGRDCRLSSPDLAAALAEGATAVGADVTDIGLASTDLLYFASGSLDLPGIMLTASHNPPNYNGMKFVREESRPISADTGLQEIRAFAERNEFGPPVAAHGKVKPVDVKPEYIEHLLSYVDARALAPLKIVVNAGNGGAGPIVDLLEPHLPFRFIKVFHEPDGSFPNGVPNPMIEETAPSRSNGCAPSTPISPSPGMATMTAVSCSTSSANSSRATTSSACWRKHSSHARPASGSCTTRA